MLHDARRPLCAKNALVHRMVAIALNITDFVVAQMNIDTAPACAHVTGGLSDFITDLR